MFIIIVLTVALAVSSLPELVGQGDDFVTQNRIYFLSLFILVPLFCLLAGWALASLPLFAGRPRGGGQPAGEAGS